MRDPEKLEAETWLVSAGRPEGGGEPLNTPLVTASTFRHGADRAYSRNDGSPGWESLEAIVAGLEGGEATSFSSGMAAIAAVIDLVPVGGEIVYPDDCYQGLAALLSKGASEGRWTVRKLPAEDTDGWLASIDSAAMLWLESPSNPLLAIGDVSGICEAARDSATLVVVDNTFATPLNQRPLERGADVVVHSATKYIGGHSDLLCGITVARSSKHAEQIRSSRTIQGATPGTMEVFLATRGIRTLAVRLRAAEANALELAVRLQAHPAIMATRYPGLPEHPGHELAARQLDGFGSMISFDLVDASAADHACERVQLIEHATSLGGVESTIERRATTPGQEHLPPGLLRMSVGIEAVEDLWADLEQAIAP
ncbi:MAG: PLP-dependent transferase [Acidimicrobiales bacterium]|nr:PLP-dependent transferase [Acidimicrobiales bacterium]